MCVCVCVLCLALGRCWWTAAAGSSSLHCALSFSLSKHTHTHRQTIKQTLYGHCPVFLQNNFSCAELFWLPCLFFFLTADWTTCSTCLLVPWVPALSLWLQRRPGDSRSIQWDEGSWYTLCRFPDKVFFFKISQLKIRTATATGALIKIIWRNRILSSLEKHYKKT